MSTMRSEPESTIQARLDLGDFSLETTGKAVGEVGACVHLLPPGTPINVAFLGNETDAQRVAAARTIREHGFEPVPIVSARRLTSEAHLDSLLDALFHTSAPRRLILVGGDPASPAGPFADCFSLLTSRPLQRHPPSAIGIVGYPQGHHRIADETLWNALRDKADILYRSGIAFEITTQYCLEPRPIIDWIGRLRGLGIDCPVRMGIPGPAAASRLVRFADLFGVPVPDELRQRLPGEMVGFGGFVETLLDELRSPEFGSVRSHLYPFGGTSEAVTWLDRALASRDASTGVVGASI